jgi:hypothetical protein
VRLPVIWRSRRLFREVSMSDEATCVGIALHAVIFDKLYGVSGRLARFMLRVRRNSDNRAV